MEAWKRKRWSRNVGALAVVGRGRLCAICRGGDHHEEHCEEAPEPLRERAASVPQEDEADAARDLSEG
ncbi:hypothetical protein CPter291_3263 [Collimonas pratensis]|uniref:Uncharacterized protein n=1 Tax=Collimonas pratensis TaxID=279113 RepID=A0ABM5Z8M1_9BURK|nr:hypothetical protein CPter291_3263 [Collimonas pratensis]